MGSSRRERRLRRSRGGCGSGRSGGGRRLRTARVWHPLGSRADPGGRCADLTLGHRTGRHGGPEQDGEDSRTQDVAVDVPSLPLR